MKKKSEKRLNAVADLMAMWFGLDCLTSSKANQKKYASMGRLWVEDYSTRYDFSDRYNRWYTTTDPSEAKYWLEIGLTLESVDGWCQCEWEEEYGIEVEY